MRKRTFILLGLLAVGRVSECVAQGSAPASPPDQGRAGSIAASLVHDRTDVKAITQMADGSVVGIGWINGLSLLRWRADKWEKIGDVPPSAGAEVYEFDADPTRPGELVSLWRGSVGGGKSMLYVWRHSLTGPAQSVASFPTPNDDVAIGRWELPSLAFDAEGNIWLTFPCALCVRIPAKGGDPEVIPIAQEYFRIKSGKRLRMIYPVIFTADRAGGGWLWTVQRDSGRWSETGEFFRPLRIIDGRITPVAAIEGLPAEGAVTMVQKDTQGRTIWAVEGRGLWRIDTAAGTAESIDSPPGVWRILKWQAWPDGLETAWTCSKDFLSGQMGSEVWVRRDGVWLKAGWSGDDHSITGGLSDWALRPGAWVRYPGGLLGLNAHLLLAMTFTHSGAEMRNLDWRDGMLVGDPKKLHALPDGNLLVAGRGTSVVSPGQLSANRIRAETDLRAWTFAESPTSDTEGRLWLLRTSGRSAAAIWHWDGGAWHEWSLPAEANRGPAGGLRVDVNGRVAVFLDQLDKPAWVRDPASPEGWRRWSSGVELIAAWADEAVPVKFLPVPRIEGELRPIFRGDGEALVAYHGLWHRREKVWTCYDMGAMGVTPERYGFEADGAPWAASNGKRRALGSDGRWVDAGRFEQRETPRGVTDERPVWLKTMLGQEEFRWMQRDSEGVWWGTRAGELWKACAGTAVQVFEPGEPSPFAVGKGFDVGAVKVGARGHRLFEGRPNILLQAIPGPTAEIIWDSVAEQADRVGRVRGAGVVYFEWRLDGGDWTRGEGDSLALRELTVGHHTLEVRGYSRKLDAGAIVRQELQIDYAPVDRMALLLAQLGAADHGARVEAVRRLVLLGEPAKQAVQAALARETYESRRWWLRAALQAIEDKLRPDKSLTTP